MSQNPWEPRDKINERMQQAQKNCVHYYDTDLIDNAPNPFRNSRDHMNRRDGRDGINDRLNTIFNDNLAGLTGVPNHQMQQSVFRPEIFSQSGDLLLDRQFSDQNFETSRVRSKDLINQQMNDFSSLPRNVHAPIKDNKSNLPSQTWNNQNQNQNQNRYQSGPPPSYVPARTQQMDQEGFIKQAKPSGNIQQGWALNREGYIPGSMQSSRTNFREDSNQRLQQYTPLGRTANMPTTSTDFATSISQEVPVMRDGRNVMSKEELFRQQEARKQNWNKMSQNLNSNGQPNLSNVVQENRPIDTRQMY